MIESKLNLNFEFLKFYFRIFSEGYEDFDDYEYDEYDEYKVL